MRRYQNSYCKNGYLHDLILIKQTSTGVLERCSRCGFRKHFPHDTPNHIYLSFHIRSALQSNDPLFAREYPTV